ncbi:MAG: PQQ-binding-like beta-propeller repeat protein [Phycisphaeraceae bacterium]|nr:PQQ-binding-like beta-propeller repeat protein [Phycisphaeraceae bacterium]
MFLTSNHALTPPPASRTCQWLLLALACALFVNVGCQDRDAVQSGDESTMPRMDMTGRADPPNARQPRPRDTRDSIRAFGRAGGRQLWQVTPAAEQGVIELAVHPRTRSLIATRGPEVFAMGLELGELRWTVKLPLSTFHVAVFPVGEVIMLDDLSRWMNRSSIFRLDPRSGRHNRVEPEGLTFTSLLAVHDRGMLLAFGAPRTPEIGLLDPTTGQLKWRIASRLESAPNHYRHGINVMIDEQEAILASAGQVAVINLLDQRSSRYRSIKSPPTPRPDVSALPSAPAPSNPPRIVGDYIGGSPVRVAVSPEHIVRSVGSQLICLQRPSGNLLWTITLADPPIIHPARADSTESSADQAALGPPVEIWRPRAFASLIDEDRQRIYITRNDLIASIDLATGATVWTVKPGSLTALVDPRDTQRHDEPNPHAAYQVQPPLRYGPWLLATVHGVIVAFEPSNGHEVWRIALPGPTLSPPVIHQDTLYVATRNLRSPGLTGDSRITAYRLPNITRRAKPSESTGTP